MRFATTTDPKAVKKLRTKLATAAGVCCDKVAVFIRGPGGYVDVLEVAEPREAQKIVRDVNVLRPASGYRAFVRPLRFELA